MSVEEQWDIEGLERHLKADFAIELPVSTWLSEDNNLHEETLRERIIDAVQGAYDEKGAMVGDAMRQIEKQVMLQVLDSLWKEHLQTMDQLRQGIHLRAYANKNPKQEYKRESFALFEDLLDNIKYETIRYLSHIEVATQEDMQRLEQQRREEQKNREYQHAQAQGMASEEGAGSDTGSGIEARQPVQRLGPKVGRNDPCICGSGKKYKQCCGRIQ